MDKRKKYNKVWMLGVVLVIIYTYPFLSVADKKSAGALIPPLYAYLFITWIIAIILLFFTGEYRSKGSDKNNKE
ncbi:hypothetical protein CJD36_010840 [Flavipsychrobacter stenotrophus]|uniref:Uncharacterized protein n=1 Tax=Flavipsychrobacter stenotrophus TaxID=2077091 RepID=A0A2S7SUP3_9BACT|nr:hypothetical protein [Flavipsychrobacter stenotrophus]PQJ10464.1 hypothetical protein CJD36_010840 [Flavipsychrobacter stenotrophus]